MIEDGQMAPRRSVAHALMALASTLAILAVSLMVIGPATSHHFAEGSPFHSHVFIGSAVVGHHPHETPGHHGDTGVLSVSDTSASGAGPLHIAATAGSLAAPSLPINFAAADLQFNVPDSFNRPPPRPPRYS